MSRKSYLIVLLVLLVVTIVSFRYFWRGSEEVQPSENVSIEVEVLAESLEVPWDLAFASKDRIFLTERPGRIRIIENGELKEDPWKTLEVYANGEAGLLGIALHPNFQQNHYVYVYHTYRDSDGNIRNRIVRLVDRDGKGEVDRVILDGIPGGEIHDGGRIAFGPDSKLYVTSGDAGVGDFSQDIDSFAGKILRINPDGTVPEDNPFSGSPVWSYGHRNPEGVAWHPETDHLYATEHGPSGHDELNLVEKENNYGWPEARGKGGGEDYVDPLIESGSGTWAPSGITFYSSDSFPSWKGDLFFVTLGFSRGGGRRSLHHVDFKEPDFREVENHTILLTNRFGRLRAVEEGPDGFLYLMTSNRDGRGDPISSDDRVLRIIPD